MKKTFKFAALALCAAAFAISCDKSEIEISVTPKVEKQIFTCTIDGSDAATKLGISAAGKVTWEVGDEIMIHGGAEGASRQKITLTAADISADGKTATLAVEMEPYNRSDAGVVSTLYAQYPAALVPAGNMYYECCFEGTDAPLMAACDYGNNFHFYNLCGIITYTVSGDFDKVAFEANNKETVAFDYYQVRVRDDGSGPVVNYHKPGNGFKNYTELKSIEKSVVADGSTVNYLYLPKGTNFSGGFTFKFYKNDKLVKTATSEKAVNVAHGKLLPLGNISAKLEDYVEPESSDHKSSITNATSLADQQANCYVINAAGAYKFPALKGNSSDAAGEVFDVELVWETYSNAEDVTANSVIEAVDFEDNWVYFKTPATLKPGNALIAAKNAEGKIIWSWHIWIPSTAFTAVDAGIHSSAVMSRNLGALVDTQAGEAMIDVASIGMFYQWGRKDPFPGPSVINEDYVGFGKVAGTAPSYDKVQLTITESIQKPTLLARGGYTDGSLTDPNWCPNPDAELWGDSGSKSIYDPCPAGYRIPKREESYALWTKSDFTTQAGWSYNPTYHWFTVGNPAVVFPVAGYYDGTVKTVYRTIIWNAHSDSYQGDKVNPHYAAYARRVRYEDSTLKSDRESKYKSYGCNVRCVVE